MVSVNSPASPSRITSHPGGKAPGNQRSAPNPTESVTTYRRFDGGAADVLDLGSGTSKDCVEVLRRYPAGSVRPRVRKATTRHLVFAPRPG